MTCSRSNSNKFRANAGRGLLALALCGAAGLAGAQEGGTRYAQALADANITQRYNTQLQTQIRSQADEIASLEQQLAGLDQTAGEVQPLLQRMSTTSKFWQLTCRSAKPSERRVSTGCAISWATRKLPRRRSSVAPRGVPDRDGIRPDDGRVLAGDRRQAG
jgi:hypothetical protein